MNSIKTVLGKLQDYRYPVVLALVVGVVGLIAEGIALRNVPWVITELQFAGNRLTADTVLGAWDRTGITYGREVAAVICDIVFLAGYLPLLLAGIVAAARHYPDRAGSWSPRFLAVAVLAGVFDLLEDISLLTFLLVGLDTTGSVFVFATIKTFLVSAAVWYMLGGFVQSAWAHGFWDAVRMCGFSLFAALTGPGLLAFGNQGAAIFDATALHRRQGNSLPYWLALGATLFFSLMCWGAARYAVSYKEEGAQPPRTAEGEGDARVKPLSAYEQGFQRGWMAGRTWVPRFCGIAPPLLIAFLIWSTPDLTEKDQAGGMVLVAGLVALWVTGRSLIFKDDKKKRSLDTLTYWAISCVGTILIAAGCLSPHVLRSVIGMGPLAAWFLSFSLIVPFFTFLVWAGRRAKKPFLALFLAFGFLCNAANLNDDHGLRHRYDRSENSTPPDQRRLNDAFDQWLREVGAQEWNREEKPYPVIFVAAAGGGIVAGSVITATLAELQDSASMPDAEEHIFAISGVSGGSVGAVTYAVNRGPGFDESAKKVMTSDMLSPSVASLLGPEMVQRFLPVAVPDLYTRMTGRSDGYENEFAMDRGRALDLAFEEALGKATPAPGISGRTTVAQYPPPRKGGPPALFLNTTCVETGQRMVISTLIPDDGDLPLPFETLYDVDPRVDVPLSTAACLSARFPVVSPPAFLAQWRDEPIVGISPESRDRELRRDDELRYVTVKRRYVDGGYCENSGVQTAMDVIDALRRQDGRRIAKKSRVRWRPVLIAVRMGDDRGMDTARGDYLPQRRRAPSPRRSSGFDEVGGPVFAFFNGWGGPSRPELMRARRRLYGQANLESDFVELDFPKPAILSWYMSEGQYDTVRKKAAELLSPASKRGKYLRDLLTRTAGTQVTEGVPGVGSAGRR